VAKHPQAQLKNVYEIGSTFKALHLNADYELLLKIRTSHDVAYVEENQIVRTLDQACDVESNAIWGLDRIQKELISEMDGEYRFDTDGGASIDAYIIDTGILTTHVEFAGGRAIWGANFADSTNSDCNGHGTHVAGTVAGETVGVAKKATVIGVKVLNCAGSGSYAGVISGIEFAAENAKKRNKPSVANMSLGGGYSAALNAAVQASVDEGVTFVVAAGNENQDACNVSPASAEAAITVGATYYTANFASDIRSTFSNFGSCTTIFAPGQAIRSAWIGSNTAYNTISGTSMASPHVCGVAALALEANPGSTPEQIKEILTASATDDVIDLRCTCTFCECATGTPNKLAFTPPCN